MNEFVSIVMPVYNCERTISSAIESVLNQSYQNWELIIVNDASTDETEKIVLSYKDDRIKYISLKTNGGPSAARNRGIQCAKYDYIAFEDGDDDWHREKLKLEMEKFEESDEYGMVYCAFSYNTKISKTKIPSDTFGEDELEGSIFDSLWEGNKIDTPAMVVKKKIIDIVGGFNESLQSIEDWEFALRVAGVCKIGYVNKILYEADYTVAGGVNSREEAQINTMMYLLNKYPEKDKTVILKMMFYLLSKQPLEVQRHWKNQILDFAASHDLYDVSLNVSKKLYESDKITEAFSIIAEKDKMVAFLHNEGLCGKDNKIAVYGAGKLGVFLAECLRTYGLNVVCIIDRKNVKVQDFLTVQPGNETEMIDVVFVTVRDAIWEKNLSNIYNLGGAKIKNIFEM
jgi:glycosyltransferase involved in cell wall biosynthesis